MPDFEADKPPSYRRAGRRERMEAIGGNQPFIMKADGIGWLYAPGGQGWSAANALRTD